MTWTEQVQDFELMLVLTAGFYVFVWWLAKSMNPVGVLDWRGRRYRRGCTLLLLLFFGGCEVLLLYQDRDIGTGTAASLFGGLVFFLLLVIRWWWNDWRRETAVRDAYVQKQHCGAGELVALSSSKGNRVWRWLVNSYAVFLIAALLYGLFHYLWQNS